MGGGTFWKVCTVLKDTRLEKLFLPTPCGPGVLGREIRSARRQRNARDTRGGGGGGLSGGSTARADPDSAGGLAPAARRGRVSAGPVSVKQGEGGRRWPQRHVMSTTPQVRVRRPRPGTAGRDQVGGWDVRRGGRAPEQTRTQTHRGGQGRTGRRRPHAEGRPPRELAGGPGLGFQPLDGRGATRAEAAPSVALVTGSPGHTAAASSSFQKATAQLEAARDATPVIVTAGRSWASRPTG